MVVLGGPVMSMTARKKFADAIVYFMWKGIAVARQYVKPAQPRYPATMNVRIKIKALGKVSGAFSPYSTLKSAIKLRTPAGTVWNAHWIGNAFSNYIIDDAAYQALIVDLEASTATRPVWESEAGLIGLGVVTLSVAGHASTMPVDFPPGGALYCLAKACWSLGVRDAGNNPYVDPKIWDAAAVATFRGRIVD